MRSGSRWFKQVVIVVAMLGLLTSAWPSVAQGEKPRVRPTMKEFLEQRIQTPGQSEYLTATVHSQSIQGINSLDEWSMTNFGLNGVHPSIAIGRYGQPYIVANSYFTYYDGQAWRAQSVASGQYTSLALDAADWPRYTYSDNGLKYAFEDVAGWHIETVAAAGSVSALAVNSGNRPHVAYIDNGLKYAYRDSIGWHIEQVSNAATDVALDLDTTGRPHVLYVGDGLLNYGFRDGTGWHLQTISNADNYPAQPSIAVASNGRPHISYCAWCRNYIGGVPHVNYGYYDGSAWHIESIPPANYEGWTNSISLDAADQPRIAYQSNADGFAKLVHAQKTAAGWKIRPVDRLYYTDPIYGEPEPKISLAIDAAGHSHIAYFTGGANYGFGALKYAYQQTDLGSWSAFAFGSYRDNNWEIYTANGDGTSTIRRTFDSAYDSQPTLNRGANRLAFVSNRDGNYEIYVMNTDGAGQKRLTLTSADEYLPTWSPDGSKIAFYSYRDGNAEIYVMNADGSNQTRLTDNPAWDGHPSWSPDNTQLAFASDRSGSNEIWIMNSGGSAPHQLTSGLNAVYPDWSPDGTRIAFDYVYWGEWLNVAVINVDGTGLITPMTTYGHSWPNYDYLAPKWSPSGQDLVYSQVHWVWYGNQYYWDSANIYGLDLSTVTVYPVGVTAVDWWPDWQTRDVTPPASAVSGLPAWPPTSFTVSWTSNNDAGTPSSGFRSFDVQYRDGASGAWTDWVMDTTQTSTQFTGVGGHWYCFRSRARDKAYNLEAYPGDNGDACTYIDTIPPVSAAASPRFVPTGTFTVTWRGTDNGSGVAAYDVQYRDGLLGTWTDWQINTTLTSAQFTGEYGHTYYFQSRARDALGNLENYPADDGDTATSIYQYSLSGQVLGNRDQPVTVASITANPAALNTGLSRHDGLFDLYFASGGTYTLTATRNAFGTLPPMLSVTVPASSTLPTFYLPPLDDQLSDGHFESGMLTAWNPTGDLTSTITSTAHTGNYAVLLGGIVPSDTVSGGPYFSAIEQTITMPMTLTDGTLSLLYKVIAADPLGDTLTAYLSGPTDTLTFTLSVTATAWTHRWFDISAWTSPTATLRIELSLPDKERAVGVLVDEITWGSSVVGSHPIYLADMRR